MERIGFRGEGINRASSNHHISSIVMNSSRSKFSGTHLDYRVETHLNYKVETHLDHGCRKKALLISTTTTKKTNTTHLDYGRHKEKTKQRQEVRKTVMLENE